MEQIGNVTRVEVIDDDGRSYTRRDVLAVHLDIQDQGRTLKLFLDCSTDPEHPVSEPCEFDISDFACGWSMKDHFSDDEINAMVYGGGAPSPIARPRSIRQRLRDLLGRVRRLFPVASHHE